MDREGDRGQVRAFFGCLGCICGLTGGLGFIAGAAVTIIIRG